jgi:hypothetical protein
VLAQDSRRRLAPFAKAAVWQGRPQRRPSDRARSPSQHFREHPRRKLLRTHPDRCDGDAKAERGAGDGARRRARADARLDGHDLGPAVPARGPAALARRGGTAADQIVLRKIGEALRRAPAREIGRGGDEETPRAFELARHEARIRLLADPQRKLGAFGDEIFVAIRHHQIDRQLWMPIEKGGEKRRDPPRAICRRQRDAQGPRNPLSAARRVLGVLDGGERVSSPCEQRFAGVCGGELPRRPRDELDPSRSSSAATAREAEGWVRPNSRAALEKLPVSTVRTKRASCWSRSFIRMPHLSYTNHSADGHVCMTYLSVNRQSLR